MMSCPDAGQPKPRLSGQVDTNEFVAHADAEKATDAELDAIVEYIRPWTVEYRLERLA
jgi:hypothetical protein